MASSSQPQVSHPPRQASMALRVSSEQPEGVPIVQTEAWAQRRNRPLFLPLLLHPSPAPLPPDGVWGELAFEAGAALGRELLAGSCRVRGIRGLGTGGGRRICSLPGEVSLRQGPPTSRAPPRVGRRRRLWQESPMQPPARDPHPGYHQHPPGPCRCKPHLGRVPAEQEVSRRVETP